MNLVTIVLENGLKWQKKTKKKGLAKAAFILKLEVGPHSRPYLLIVLNIQYCLLSTKDNTVYRLQYTRRLQYKTSNTDGDVYKK